MPYSVVDRLLPLVTFRAPPPYLFVGLGGDGRRFEAGVLGRMPFKGDFRESRSEVVILGGQDALEIGTTRPSADAGRNDGIPFVSDRALPPDFQATFLMYQPRR